MSTAEVEVRCPFDNQPGLMFKLLRDGEAHVVPGNSIQVTCRGCRDEARRNGEHVDQVLHEFNLLGELIDTRRV